jgi:hypothetical protein
MLHHIGRLSQLDKIDKAENDCLNKRSSLFCLSIQDKEKSFKDSSNLSFSPIQVRFA